MSITTTKKFEQFQSRPLRDCLLKDVPGVGEVAENKLKDANIDDACKIVGHFLLLGRDTDKMTQWLEDVCEIRKQEGKKIAEALAEKAEKIVQM
mmetsp:Transcript_16006/g.36952  ORF Transcript_16006/g.36952 Transcript_16006/m.36952 type:complete len:94 (-) Transcript_16006:274-555(-)|eukprot:CAMPEP_0174916566 /NCGR_PEP_ID=MMETSP1355-20121228/1887_1 /TAXON_ID=464990 /ORGANISM="Hemiselmis tepida, Strain CCMP443" /LENGTH=93 /DNA_ID=CAMNT_0016161575 /DNA_START=24 /DNA_END=305 /DNA_ORIENTATION=+